MKRSAETTCSLTDNRAAQHRSTIEEGLLRNRRTGTKTRLHQHGLHARYRDGDGRQARAWVELVSCTRTAQKGPGESGAKSEHIYTPSPRISETIAAAKCMPMAQKSAKIARRRQREQLIAARVALVQDASLCMQQKAHGFTTAVHIPAVVLCRSRGSVSTSAITPACSSVARG